MAEKSSKRYLIVSDTQSEPSSSSALVHKRLTPKRPDNTRLPDVTLMLLGKTGYGKSSLGNVILNLKGQDGFTVTDGFDSTEIQQALVKDATFHGRKFIVVDTPGVMDTNFEKEGNEERVISGICDGIVCCPDGVDAFLIVLRMGVRLTREEFDTINKLERLFGSKFWCYVIVVFTHGDGIDNDPKAFEDSLRESRDKIKALDTLMSKLRTEPLLVDAGRRRKPDIVGCQMKSLKFAVDQLMRDNKQTKYTNDMFRVAQAALALTNLQEEQRVASREVQLLKEKVDQLEAELRSEQEETRGLRRQVQKAKEMLLKAEAQYRKIEADWKKYKDDVARKVLDFGKQKCNIL